MLRVTVWNLERHLTSMAMIQLGQGRICRTLEEEVLHDERCKTADDVDEIWPFCLCLRGSLRVRK